MGTGRGSNDSSIRKTIPICNHYWEGSGLGLWYLPSSGTTSYNAHLSRGIHQTEMIFDRISQHTKAYKSL